MQTLSNGYLLPETGDRGLTWFPAIESNIQRLNDHTHNGSDSSKLDSQSIVSITSTILPGDWVLQASGIYRAPVTMPGSLLFDSKTIQVRVNNKPLYSGVERVTSNSFYAYINDNTLTATVIYG